ASESAFLLDLGILAISALAFSLVFVRFRLPIVSAQILAGMVVGPYVLGWVSDPTFLGQVASVGIVLLLFIMGLELDPVELRKIAGQVIPLTLMEVAVAFGFGIAATYILNLTLVWSIVFAMTASISSTAIVGKIILEKRMFQADESKFLVGLMVSEDIVAVGFLILISSIATPSISPSAQLVRIVEVGLGGIGVLVLAYLVATYLAPVIINYLSSYEVESDEIPFLFGLGLGMVFAVLADVLGFSPGIGAFMIGLSIRGKPSRFLTEKLSPIKDLFLVLFFVSMGSLIDPFSAFDLGVTIVISLALVITGKLFGGFLVGRILSRKHETPDLSPWTFGAWLVPRGEFSFVIGQFALATGIITGSVFSLVGLSVLVSALLGPSLQRLTEPKLAESSHLLKPQVDS
ncbi:MAG TPA: cation:proton antiporter, partial [Candidatus Bathyarchaeia archaeon]|nr:cation:proton antiporter [Candidatus Bathyarchaeia archaeon]